MRLAALQVLLRGHDVGTVTQEATGRFRFAYEEGWRRSASATPLSLSMPLTVATHQHRVVDAFLWGLLPDNDNVLKRWGRDFQVSPRNPFALLAHVGEDCAGAAQFVRPERIEEARTGGSVEWLDPEEIGNRIRRLRRDPTEWQTPLDHGQFSLAGAQAKMALLREGERWGRPSGRIPTTHIIKPAIEGFDEHDLTEHLCLRAADLVGLRVARSEIARFGDERAIVVERYDRARGSDGVVRVHQEDLCQALGILPTSKYQRDGGPSPSRIVELLRNADPGAALRSVAAFVDALVFNWIIAGTDAHAKNYSVLLSGNQVRLAPLYDVASVLPYPHVERRKLTLAMKVGGEYRLDWIGGRHWFQLAKELRLEPRALIDRASDLAARAPECFERAAADHAVAMLRSPLPDRLTERVRERAASCLRRLDAADVV